MSVTINSNIISYPDGIDKNYDDIHNIIQFDILSRKTLSIAPKNIKTIVLPLPNISINSSSDWTGVAFGMAGQKLNTMYDKLNGNKSITEQTIELAGQTLINSEGLGMIPQQIAAQVIALGINSMGGNASGEDVLGYSQGIITNPYLSASYKGTGLRTFQFNFSFFPRNENDCTIIKSIIDEFNFAHLPGRGLVGGVKWYLEYPREFDINIMINGESNKFLIPYKRSVMTSFNVDYSGGLGFYTSFPNGFPIQTNLTLGFMETVQQTREDVY